MRVKLGLKYMIILICLLLTGCSRNENMNSKQDIKQQNNINEETQIGENETIEGATKESESTQNDITENQTTVNDRNIEAENATEKALDSVTQESTNSSDELANQTSGSTDIQETTEDSESMETKIVVYKADRRLELWQNAELAGEYHIGLGKKSEGKKEQEGDKKTPEGEYYVCTKNQYSKFYLSLGVSYPNLEDAKSGLDNGLIDEDTYYSIETAIQNGQCPPWNTALGGEIMIHGHGGSTDWTKGCIGVDDEIMDILWEASSIGTKIIINP